MKPVAPANNAAPNENHPIHLLELDDGRRFVLTSANGKDWRVGNAAGEQIGFFQAAPDARPLHLRFLALAIIHNLDPE